MDIESCKKNNSEIKEKYKNNDDLINILSKKKELDCLFDTYSKNKTTYDLKMTNTLNSKDDLKNLNNLSKEISFKKSNLLNLIKNYNGNNKELIEGMTSNNDSFNELMDEVMKINTNLSNINKINNSNKELSNLEGQVEFSKLMHYSNYLKYLLYILVFFIFAALSVKFMTSNEDMNNLYSLLFVFVLICVTYFVYDYIFN